MLPKFVGVLIIFHVLSVSTGNTVRKDTIYLAVKEGMACSLDFYFQTIHMAKSKKWALKKKKKKGISTENSSSYKGFCPPVAHQATFTGDFFTRGFSFGKIQAIVFYHREQVQEIAILNNPQGIFFRAPSGSLVLTTWLSQWGILCIQNVSAEIIVTDIFKANCLPETAYEKSA